MKEAFRTLAIEARDNHKNGDNTLFYISYMGRGICDMAGEVLALTNGSKVFNFQSAFLPFA